MIMRKCLTFGLIAAAGAVACISVATASDHAHEVHILLGDGLTLRAVIEPLFGMLVIATAMLSGWPLLRAAWAYFETVVVTGRGWCLRLVQDLRQPHTAHLGLMPRYMTGYGPLFA